MIHFNLSVLIRVDPCFIGGSIYVIRVTSPSRSLLPEKEYRCWYDGTVGTVGTGDEVRYENACSLRISEAEQRKLAESIQNDRLRGRLSTIGLIALIGFAGLLGGSAGLGWAGWPLARGHARLPHRQRLGWQISRLGG